jgi:hypothetical protein
VGIDESQSFGLNRLLPRMPVFAIPIPYGLLAMAIPPSLDAPCCRHPSVTIFIVKGLDKDSHKDSYRSDSGVKAAVRV